MPAPKATRIGSLPTQPQIAAHIELQTAGELVRYMLGSADIIIGRDSSCDLRVGDAYASARHAAIRYQGQADLLGSYTVADLDSTNGTFLNGQRLRPQQPTPLHDGDQLHLDDPAHEDALLLIFHAGLSVESHERYELGTRPVQIGRSESEILLEHPLISRNHAQIRPQGNHHLLIDLNSTNGTLVNGVRIEQHQLQRGDTIQIGIFQLIYHGTWVEVFRSQAHRSVVAQNLMRRAGPHTILHDVSLVIQARELVALLGASGAGKSTLLSLLSGHSTPDAGQVHIGGVAPASLAAIGYLPQEEPIHRTLTVERALRYTAELRLPPDTSSHEIDERIAATLAEVGLSDQRTIAIGQISGGQRKRVALAAELLANPAALLLDEPTAALDPGLERRMFATLRSVADEGRAVIVATHATESIQLCDLVAVLAAGRVVFYGPPGEVAAFFGVTSIGEVYEVLSQSEAGSGSGPQSAEVWADRFRNSAWHTRYVSERIAASGRGQAPQGQRQAPRRRTHQLGILVRRGWDVLTGDMRNLAILLIQAPLIGLLLALVAKPDALVGERAAANEAKKVLFMLAITAIWCGVINAARAIVGERAIWQREYLAGVRVLPYLGAKLVVLLPLLVAQSLALIAAVMLRVALPAAGVIMPFAAEILFTTLLAGLAGIALGLAISAAAHTADRVGSLIPLALIPQILFAGVIFSLGDGLSVQRALSWLTISRWAMDAYGASASLGSLPVLPGMLRPLTAAAEYSPTLEHLLGRWLALGLFATVCMLIAGWRLRR